MITKEYGFRLTGITPLLLHADIIEWADQMEAWKNDPNNKNKSRAGDDRTPPWRWIGCLYLDGQHITITNDLLSRALMAAAARVPIPGGKNQRTFKQDTMASMFIPDLYLTLLVNGKQVPQAEIEKLMKVDDFAEHQKRAAELGMPLYLKRAKIGMSKHIRVRPRCDVWEIRGRIQVWDEKLDKALPTIFEIAGSQMGLGDWRPNSRTPGPFGRFKAELTESTAKEVRRVA